MLEEGGRITKAQIIKKIQALLDQDVDMDAEEIFSRIQDHLEPVNEDQDMPGSGIGYVHIDEDKEEEYRQWEDSIKQEWLETIESIRQGLKNSRK